MENNLNRNTLGTPPAFLQDLNNMFQTLEIVWHQNEWAAKLLSDIVPLLDKQPDIQHKVIAVISSLAPLPPLWKNQPPCSKS